VRILVTGGTGFIGRALVSALLRERHTVLVWARSASRARSILGDAVETVAAGDGVDALARALDECDAVVNLAGESIMGGRWTAARREVLRRSRIATTELVVGALAAAQPRPRVLVSGSAVGYYGDRGATPLTEASAPGSGFLAELSQEWESAARAATKVGTRVVLTRIGIVLGRDGGALAPMAIPFRFGIGGRLGSGTQYMSWIHLEDLVSVILTVIEHSAFEGPVNCVAPETVTNRQFTRSLGRALHRPALMAVPGFALRVVLGEASSALLEGQRVRPAVLESHGFRFRFPSLDGALTDILGPRTS
jgi:uncharacterized protein (TIGR01777 family)